MTDKMTLKQAMRRAFSLGQTYWDQADSDSCRKQGKAEGTRQKFEELLRETIETHIAVMGEPVAEVQQCEPYLDGSTNPMKQLKWTLSNCEGDLPVGTKLYLAPPASSD